MASAFVELLREPMGGAVRVTRLPPWVRTPRGEYWHQPRSAEWYPNLVWDDARAELVEDGLRLVVSSWCGVGVGTLRAGPPQFAVEPPEQLRCGTCVGRRLGWLQEQGLVFRPRTHFDLPTWCPGEYDPDAPRRCFACGARVSAARGWWASGIATHRPAPELAERCRPCPRHGWKHVGPAYHPAVPPRRVVCRAHDGQRGTCGYDCGPVGILA